MSKPEFDADMSYNELLSLLIELRWREQDARAEGEDEKVRSLLAQQHAVESRMDELSAEQAAETTERLAAEQ